MQTVLRVRPVLPHEIGSKTAVGQLTNNAVFLVSPSNPGGLSYVIFMSIHLGLTQMKTFLPQCDF